MDGGALPIRRIAWLATKRSLESGVDYSLGGQKWRCRGSVIFFYKNLG